MQGQVLSIEGALNEILSAPQGQKDIIQALKILKRVVTNLANNPNEETFKVLCKSNTVLAKELFIFPGALKFLKTIGFEEKSGVFKFAGRDDQVKALEGASKVISNQLSALETDSKSQKFLTETLNKNQGSIIDREIEKNVQSPIRTNGNDDGLYSGGFAYEPVNKRVKNVNDVTDNYQNSDKNRVHNGINGIVSFFRFG